MSGGKGGSQTTKVDIPQWMEDAARSNLAQGERTAEIGYTPYYGPDVAAFSPMQQASMQNTADASSAFGLSTPQDAMAGMPQAQTFAGGVQGYSSAPMFEQAVDTFRENRPGQYKAYVDSGPIYDPYKDSGSNVYDPTARQPVQPIPTGDTSYQRSPVSGSIGGAGGYMSAQDIANMYGTQQYSPIDYGSSLMQGQNIGVPLTNLGLKR
mgnify:CR=1 FL=1